MFDHLSLAVRDLTRSKEFYTQALAPLGAAVQMEFEGGVGIGPKGKPAFWLGEGEPPPKMHFAFAAPDRAAVDAFYRAALAAGAQDNGAPGVREQYHPTYYAAFVLDPDGHNVEAVCHAPPGAARKPRQKTAARSAAKRSPAKKAPRTAGRGAARPAKRPTKKAKKARRG
jgi:catechol 2,3-dioxygenase-like lactoylglutathione lyase family enzyme